MRVLVAVSLEDDCLGSILEAVRKFPWPAGSRFRVITVSANVHPSAPELVASAATVADIQHTVVTRADAFSAETAAQLRDLGMEADSVSVTGDPKSEIIRNAKDWDADLLVVGSSGHSKLERWMLGSVSRGIATDAPVSVLVVKAHS